MLFIDTSWKVLVDKYEIVLEEYEMVLEKTQKAPTNRPQQVVTLIYQKNIRPAVFLKVLNHTPNRTPSKYSPLLLSVQQNGRGTSGGS